MNKTLSFEFFPPKKELDITAATEAVDKLSIYHPDFMSVTCGAMGTTNTQSIGLLRHIYNLGIRPVAHITCINSCQESVAYRCQEFLDNGICSVLALRGDIPQDFDVEDLYKLDFTHATDLISFISENFNEQFDIYAAAYPEMHPEAVDFATDISWMLKKQELGVSTFITQLFFDNDVFYRFLSRARSAGITARIIPGVMPITSYSSISRILQKTSTLIPRQLQTALTVFKGNKEAIKDIGIIFTANQILDLLANDVDGIHIYSMNNADNIIKLLGYVENALKTYRKIS